MGKNDRKFNKALKRAGLSKKWWKKFDTEEEYKKALAEFTKEYEKS